MKTIENIALVALLVVAVGAGIWIIQHQDQKDTANQVNEVDLSELYSDQERGFSINYPSDFKIQKLSEEEQDEVSLKIINTDPPAQITVWQETGLQLLEQFVAKPLLDQLRQNVDRVYSSSYPEIRKEGIKDAKLGGEDAFSVQFTFKRPGKEFRERIYLTVSAQDSSAYYVQCLAPVAYWDQIERTCQAITDSFSWL